MANSNLARVDASPAEQPTSWRDTALIPLLRASEIAGISVASLYKMRREGRLDFRKLAGRTLVTTESLERLIDDAETYRDSARTDNARTARAARAERARSAWVE